MKRRLDQNWQHRTHSTARSLGAHAHAGVSLAQRSDLHIPRKIWHMGMGLLIVFIYMTQLGRVAGVLTLGVFLAWDVLMETARLRLPVLNQQLMRIMGPIMRSSEANQMSGVPYYILSCMLAIAVFPKTVAILSILYLACGDPIASLFGILYGRNSIRFPNGKSLVGTAAGVGACMAVTLLFLVGQQGQGQMMNGAELFGLTLLGGLVGGTVELIPWDLDDNFTIPLVSGFVLWLAFILLGY